MQIINQEIPCSNIANLNQDALHLIFNQLDSKDFCRLTQVSQYFKSIMNTIWGKEQYNTVNNRQLLAKAYVKQCVQVQETSLMIQNTIKHSFLVNLKAQRLDLNDVDERLRNGLDQVIKTAVDNKITSIISKMKVLMNQRVVTLFSLTEIKRLIEVYQDPVMVSLFKKIPQMTQLQGTEELDEELGEELAHQITLLLNPERDAAAPNQ